MKIMSIHFIEDRKGQTLVEFALVAPILFLVIFGACEFGYAWMQNNTVTSAAREGARAAAVANDASAIQGIANARAQQLLTAANISGASVTCPKMPTFSDPIFSVAVTVPYTPIVGSYIIRGLTINLTGTTAMRFEGPL